MLFTNGRFWFLAFYCKFSIHCIYMHTIQCNVRDECKGPFWILSNDKRFSNLWSMQNVSLTKLEFVPWWNYTLLMSIIISCHNCIQHGWTPFGNKWMIDVWLAIMNGCHPPTFCLHSSMFIYSRIHIIHYWFIYDLQYVNKEYTYFVHMSLKWILYDQILYDTKAQFH